MKHPVRKINGAMAALLIVSGASATTQAGIFSRKKKQEANVAPLKGVQKDSAELVKRVADSRLVKKGMFDCYIDKDGKLLIQIPDSALNHTYLLSSRVSGISSTSDLVAGQMNITPLVIRFTKDDNSIFMHIVQDLYEVNPNDPIKKSYDRNVIDPVVKGFKIINKDGKSSLIDATSFFCGGEKLLSPIKDSDPIAKALSGRGGVEGSFYQDGSSITAVKSFPDNIMIESRLAFTTRKVQDPYTVIVSRSLLRLPDNPMKSRLQDNRVGFFHDRKRLYSSDRDDIKSYNIINRFRVEPKPEDMEKYLAGELVEPEKKIVFYVDPAFPDKWRKAVKEGIEYWNIAFEKAGFKNVVEARDYPTDNSGFDPDDVRFNCVRYSITPTANAMGPSYVDPRSGEIIGADVIWYHNVISLVHNWRFAQTAAVDPRVRNKVFADDVMHESLTYVTAHEIGHCLGLMHNMGASYAYTLENLRDPKFTQQYGTTPSIMDYARNNFVAQPGDLEKGVRLTPPPVGVYDIHAINWGYRLIPGKNLFEEKPVLDAWIAEKGNDPMYEFGAQQVLGLVDPTDQTEDLGNDHMKAGDMAISNLKIIMENLEDWCAEPGENYDSLRDTYLAMLQQYNRHVGHVYPYIGGVVYKEIRQGGEDAPVRSFIPKKDTKRAMDWLLTQVRTCDWMEPAHLTGKFEDLPKWRDKMTRNIVGCVFSPLNLNRIKQGGEIDSKQYYTINEFLDDAFKGIFKSALAGGKLSDIDRNMQSLAIETMIKGSGLEPVAKKNSKSLTDEFEEMMAQGEAPSIPCSHTACLDDDHARSFFRIVLGDPALPSAELQPLMTSRLKKALSIMKKGMAAASDESTRDFYDYQIRRINSVLNQ